MKKLDELIKECEKEHIRQEYYKIRKNFLYFPGEREFVRKLRYLKFFLIEQANGNVKSFYYVEKAEYEKDIIKINKGYDIINNREIIDEEFNIKNFYFMCKKN